MPFSLFFFFSHSVKYFTHTELKIGLTTHAWHIESAQEITGARSAYIRCKREKWKTAKMENKQLGKKKAATTSLDKVIFSRQCEGDPGDNGLGWCGKSPPERAVPSPWKQILSQGTSNANLNEMSHPRERNRYTSLQKRESEGFLSQQKKY